MGCQLNLDKGEGQIIDGFIMDDIRSPATILEIVFECKNKCTFTDDDTNYFSYMGIDWAPLSHTEEHSNAGLWHYVCSCYPRQLMTIIKSPCDTSKKLASLLGLSTTSDSNNLKIRCPIVNVQSAKFIMQIRNDSFNVAYNEENIGNAHFIYVSSKFYSNTWSSLANQNALSLTVPKLLQGQSNIKFTNSTMMNELSAHAISEVWHEGSYLKRILGKKFEIFTTQPVAFGKMYTMKFEDTDAWDQSKRFMCVSTKKKLTELYGYINTFSEVNYI